MTNQSSTSAPWRTLPGATGRSAFGDRLKKEARGRVILIVADRDVHTARGKRTEVVAKSQAEIFGFLMRETDTELHVGVSAQSRPDLVDENEWPCVGFPSFLWFVIAIKKSRIIEIHRLGK